MAIYDKKIIGGNGISYTKEVDSSVDYSGLTNNTYFKNLSDDLIYLKNGSGEIIRLFDGLNLGNSDLTLSGDRTVNLTGNSLTYVDSGPTGGGTYLKNAEGISYTGGGIGGTFVFNLGRGTAQMDVTPSTGTIGGFALGDDRIQTKGFVVNQSKGVIDDSVLSENNLYYLYLDSGELKGRYKDNLGVTGDVTIGTSGQNFANTDLTIESSRVQTLTDSFTIDSSNAVADNEAIVLGNVFGGSATGGKIQLQPVSTASSYYFTAYQPTAISSASWNLRMGYDSGGLPIVEGNGALRLGANGSGTLEIDAGANRMVYNDGSLDMFYVASNSNCWLLPGNNKNFGVGLFTPTAKLHTQGDSSDSVFIAESSGGIHLLEVLSSNVKVQGTDTLPTSTAFEIYDGDVTPSKLWDFRNNGDVYLGKSEQVIYGADAVNSPVLAFKAVGSGHNLVKVGEGAFRTVTETAFHVIGKGGVSTVSDGTIGTSDFIFEQNTNGAFTIVSDNTVTLELQNSDTSGFSFIGTTNYFAFLSDFTSYPYAFHKGKGHWFSISGSEVRGSNFESGITHVFEDGGLQMWSNRITATGSNFASLGGSIKFVADQRTPTNAYSNDLEIAPNTDVNGNYWLEFKNTGGSVGLKINGNDALPMLPEFTVAGVPAADADNKGGFVCITDETGGYVTAFSDGTNWRRTTDRAIIS